MLGKCSLSELDLQLETKEKKKKRKYLMRKHKHSKALMPEHYKIQLKSCQWPKDNRNQTNQPTLVSFPTE